MHNINISEDGFMNMLNNQNGGALVDELNRELAKGVGAVLDNNGKSTITLKISIQKISGMDKGMVIKDDVTVSHPKEVRPSSAMFVSNGNGLLIQPQAQTTFNLDQSTGEILDPLADSVDPIKSTIEAQ